MIGTVKTIHIKVSDTTYYRLLELKAKMQVETWADFVVKAFGLESIEKKAQPEPQKQADETKQPEKQESAGSKLFDF